MLNKEQGVEECDATEAKYLNKSRAHKNYLQKRICRRILLFTLIFYLFTL